jgi:hypothetical protein
LESTLKGKAGKMEENEDGVHLQDSISWLQYNNVGEFMLVYSRLYLSLHAVSAAELHIRIFNVFYLKFHLLYELWWIIPCVGKP